jgi:thiamine-monophosphate kinase
MNLRSLRERDLISAIRKEFSGAKKNVVLGIGDDAAAVRGGRTPYLLTTDLLVEDVHFIAKLHPPFLLGRKALNINLSDIAAMGGRPRFALLSMALRRDVGTSWLKEFLAGFKAAAQAAGTALVGGDISGAEKIAVSVSVIGEGKYVIRRSGARPGDLIFISGCLGNAAAGFRLLRRGHRRARSKHAAVLLRAFLDPTPQLDLGLALARRKLATAMIDTSDGLSVDLHHLCEESRTGALVELASLPLSPALRRFEKAPLELALHGGEDYRLLFTTPSENLPRIARLRKKFRLRRIGTMTRGRGVFLVDAKGRKRELETKGFEHLI